METLTHRERERRGRKKVGRWPVKRHARVTRAKRGYEEKRKRRFEAFDLIRDRKTGRKSMYARGLAKPENHYRKQRAIRK